MKGVRAHVLKCIADDTWMTPEHCNVLAKLLQPACCAQSVCFKITPSTAGKKVWCFSVTLLDVVRFQYVQRNDAGIGHGIQETGLPAGEGVYICDSSVEHDLLRAGEVLSLNARVVAHLYVYMGQWLFHKWAAKTLESCSSSSGGFLAECMARVNNGLY